MANDLNMSTRKKNKKVKLLVRLSIPILLVVLFQLVTFFAILIFGGEFKNIQEYAYNTLVEKTENRSNYIQNNLQEKPTLVQEYSTQIGSIVADILQDRGETIADLSKDKDLNRSIIESSVNIMVNLMRRAKVNDAYLILESGDLYADESIAVAKPALYLRDVDPNSGSGYDDLLMEIGYTSISQDYGITRHSGWSLYFTPNPDDTKNFDFYYHTMETAQENSNLSPSYLGYWSGFSKPSSMTTASMKYTFPLITEDGTVYGVLGVGLTESTILSNIPSNDFLGETACYILGRSTSENNFDVMTYSGSSYDILLGSTDTLQVGKPLDEGIYDFNMATDVPLSGSVQNINLYNPNSPYAEEKWALISVADRTSVLRPLIFLRQMLLVSAAISLLVAVVVAIFSCIQIIKPISNAIKLMNTKRSYNEILHFQSSNVYEIDQMTSAITQLQINVQDFSSQVSRIIRIADVGLGTFMYNRGEDTIFVGQSMMEFQLPQMRQEQDTVISRQEFLDSLYAEKLRTAIQEGLDLMKEGAHDDQSAEYRIDQADGSTQWVRLGLIYADNGIVGVVQNITDTMLEKKRIEFERDYDRLTGLLNRHAYYQRIQELFHDKSKLKITAFIMLDLDNLKFVNDTYGHDFGDDYIKTAATILESFENYGGIVSRISGDEFNICMPGFSSKDEVREIISNVRDKLAQSSCLLADGTHFKIRASMGISWYPDDSTSYEMLMKYADFAMYTVKHSTKGAAAEFDMASYSMNAVLLTGVEEMNRIIEQSRVRYAFQCIVSAKTGEIYGYEALMRIQSKIFQSPPELLRAAKAGAKLYEIERLTWQRALADFQVQISAGHIEKTAHIFINSIANCKLEPADEAAIEKRYAHLLDHIVMEILENESSNEDIAAHKAQLIERWNGQFALDDFGTGYNSEYALLTIQPNIIKLDRSIISGCDKDESRRIIITNLVKLARTKNIFVLAEGVETEAELKTVIACGVDLLQGYYLSHPLFDPQPIAPEIVETIQQLAQKQDNATA